MGIIEIWNVALAVAFVLIVVGAVICGVIEFVLWRVTTGDAESITEE